jgi:hypothetical protein
LRRRLVAVGRDRNPPRTEPEVAHLGDGGRHEHGDPRTEQGPHDDIGEPVGRQIDARTRHHEHERHGEQLPTPPPFTRRKERENERHGGRCGGDGMSGGE